MALAGAGVHVDVLEASDAEELPAWVLSWAGATQIRSTAAVPAGVPGTATVG